jgi:hypothetical protein
MKLQTGDLDKDKAKRRDRIIQRLNVCIDDLVFGK